MLNSNKEVINYILKTYAPDNVIAKMDSKIVRYTQPSNRTPPDYAASMLNEVLHCDFMYD